MQYEIALLFLIAISNIAFAYVILRGDRKITSYLFSTGAISVALWSAGIGFFLITQNLESALIAANIYYIAAGMIVLAFYYFTIFFQNRLTLRHWAKLLYVIPLAFFIFALITYPNLLITSIFFTADGAKGVTINMWTYSLYAIYFTIYVGLSYYQLIKQYHLANNSQKLAQIRFIGYGTAVTYIFGAIFNLIMPALGRYDYIWIGPIFSFVMIGTMAYAITRHRLFNVKVIATELFVGVLSITYFTNIFIVQHSLEKIINSIIFAFSLGFGYLLIVNVKSEIKSREEVSDLAKRLTESNWELARTNERLRIIDQRKSEFVSIVSHQLRTPITAIKGYASMILEESYGAIPASLKTPIEKIFLSSKRLAEMVNDFLDLSKIEQGKMSYNFTSVDIKKMLKDIEEEFTPIAKKKGLRLEFNLGGEESCIVTADEGKIRQIFTNIIDNSIKYTPEGSVDISLEKNTEEGKIIVRIKDTGIGLSQDDIHHLFGKFTRGEGGQKEYTEGSGLGLYVAKQMLEAHHGKIWVDSQGIGKGSEFVIELLREEEV